MRNNWTFPHLLLIGIGGLSVIASLVRAVLGTPFADYLPGIAIGVTLMGSAYLLKQAQAKEKKKQ